MKVSNYLYICMYACLGQVLLSQIKLPELVTFNIQDSVFKTFRSSLQGTEKAGSYFHAMLNWAASEGKNGEMRLYVCMYVCNVYVYIYVCTQSVCMRVWIKLVSVYIYKV